MTILAKVKTVLHGGYWIVEEIHENKYKDKTREPSYWYEIYGYKKGEYPYSCMSNDTDKITKRQAMKYVKEFNSKGTKQNGNNKE